MKQLAWALTAAAMLIATAPASNADPIADFYRGKSLRMLIGYGPGGGYDLYGRLVAEFLPRHIPGNPMIVPQNMPGGGSFVAAKFMAEAAPKDGTVFGSLAQTLALDSMTNTTTKLDMTKFSYLGRVVTNIDTGVTLPKSGIKSFEDVRAKQYIVGTSGGGSTTVLFPSALNAYGGAKLKLVRGYSGTTDIVLAMERGEVDIVGAYGLPGIMVSQPGWVARGEATFLYQAALKRHRLIPNVPTLPELALNDEGRVILHAAASTGEFGRSILTTPGVPQERLAALRAAFQRMLADPDFLAAVAKRNVMVDPATGEALDAVTTQTMGLPKSTIEALRTLLKG